MYVLDLLTASVTSGFLGPPFVPLDWTETQAMGQFKHQTLEHIILHHGNGSLYSIKSRLNMLLGLSVKDLSMVSTTRYLMWSSRTR